MRRRWRKVRRIGSRNARRQKAKALNEIGQVGLMNKVATVLNAITKNEKSK
jgi:hypothetical protein